MNRGPNMGGMRDALQAVLPDEGGDYEIVRFRFKHPAQVLAQGVTLETAQEWCDRESTHGDGWFDGYRRM